MSTLAETQELFWKALRGEAGELDSCFAGTPELPAAERVAIYASMFLHRQVDALREDFPKVAAQLGDAGFFQLCRDYVLAHPSEDADLGKLGRKLSQFIEDPALSQLAAIEWARAEVFFAADVETLTPEEFASRIVDPALFAETRAAVIPALQLLRTTAVWRKGFDVFHVDLPDAEARALQLALGGATLGEICAAFPEPAEAFTALQSWLAEGWLQR